MLKKTAKPKKLSYMKASMCEGKKETVLEEKGNFADIPQKQSGNPGVIGVSLGITKNMGDFNSLRVDAWITDTIQEGETKEEAFNRNLEFLDKMIDDTVKSYL